jgi:hypothetical protein
MMVLGLIISIILIYLLYQYLSMEGLSFLGNALLQGDLSRDISDSNPSSWSNLLNYSLPKNIRRRVPAPVTYYGQIPVIYEQRPAGTLLPDTKNATHMHPSMLYHYSHQVSPDCCPAVYSTDQGCICWEPPKEKHVQYLKEISPRS